MLKAAWIYLRVAPEAPSSNFYCCSEIKKSLGLWPVWGLGENLFFVAFTFCWVPYSTIYSLLLWPPCLLLLFSAYKIPSTSSISHNIISILKSQSYHICKKKKKLWDLQGDTHGFQRTTGKPKHLKQIIRSWYLGFESHPTGHNQ